MGDDAKKYDIILFGVTGFTGKLVAEYFLNKKKKNNNNNNDDDDPSYHDLKWAVSARNVAKAERVLEDVINQNFTSGDGTDDDTPPPPLPPILQADLLCETDEQKDTLRDIVQQTKVVLTCSGPFEKYGQTLVSLCAEYGVSYADITGESDYFRSTVAKHDKTAQETGAVILCHCGHDCIPSDLTVYELHQYAQQQGYQIKDVMTYQEFGETFGASGGTVATATYQMGKDRSKQTKNEFDPLLTTVDGIKSEYSTKNITPKSSVTVPELDGKSANTWIMAPVMVNCVKRSNALLGYNKALKYGDAEVSMQSMTGYVNSMIFKTVVGASMLIPSVFSGFVPQPGDGPDREAMENGYLKLHGIATLIKEQGDGEGEQQQRRIQSLFQFNKDTGYLYTAALLAETGMELLRLRGTIPGGCKTPASALGHNLTERILKSLDCSFEIREIV